MFSWPSDKKKEQEAKSQIAGRQALYCRVFDTPDGKAVLEDLKPRCFVNRTTLSDNPANMGWAEGRRSIHFYITNLIEKDLTEILTDLMKEE